MSTFDFYDIRVYKDGKIAYEWMCEVCGVVQLNVVEDSPPDECDNCNKQPREKK